MEHILWIDDDIIPGAYYGESTWIWPPSYPNQITPEELAMRTTEMAPMFPHAHDFPELLAWWGSDPDHPEDTNTMGMIMGDEEILLDRSWICYIPAGMLHMPTRIPDGRVTDKPVCHWTFGPGTYTREKEDHNEEKDLNIDTPKPGAPKKKTKNNLKYFVFGGDQQNINKPDYMRELDPRYARHMAYIDENTIPGCELGCDTMYLMPGDRSKSGMLMMDPHTLPHGTSITFTAMNYDDITDLSAEVELWIGGEKKIINRCFGAYIPPNVEQGPLIIRNIRKQVFFMISYPVGKGIKKYPGGK